MILLLLLLLQHPSCGVERHAVKVGADQSWASVQQKPETTTVLWLRSQPHPTSLPAERRAVPVETHVWTVRAVVVGWKREVGDGDYHIVIADSATHTATMIAESIDPRCAPARLRLTATTVRAVLAHLGAPSTAYHRFPKPIPAWLTGVGFMDYLHGQTGVAGNGVELHPLTQVQFSGKDSP